MAVAGVVVWALTVELVYLVPYVVVVMEDYGVYLAAQGVLMLVALSALVYAGARSVSLGSVGRKLDVVERAIRRGAGQDADLAQALARDETGDYQ